MSISWSSFDTSIVAMVAALLVLAAVALLVTRLPSLRRRTYQAFARRRRLRCQPFGPDELWSQFGGRPPFGRGRHQQAADVLEGTWRGRPALGFTYSYLDDAQPDRPERRWRGRASGRRHWQVAAVWLSDPRAADDVTAVRITRLLPGQGDGKVWIQPPLLVQVRAGRPDPGGLGASWNRLCDLADAAPAFAPSPDSPAPAGWSEAGPSGRAGRTGRAGD